ncbi:prepilin peptidase [Patescibacteria group bacterium]|jgi:leader peptidase (prepilin peptidase)/N-methyltransferase|nr:prepilin peptidase [Patescibacteria group bacterium]
MILERAVGIVFACILGLIWGSFANVVAIRWHENASLWGRSVCPGCRRTLRPRHLVPVLSWIWLRGKCADCKKKIHIQYPLVELLCGVLGAIAALRFDPMGPEALRFWFEFVISMGLIVPVVMDLRWKEVPVEYLAGLTVIAYGFGIALFGADLSVFKGTNGFVAVLLSPFVAMSIPVAFFGIQYQLSQGRWIGAGDLWIGALIGAVAGRPAMALIGMYFSYLLGGGAALIGYLAGVFRRGDRLPFAPALAGGTLLMMWFGESVLAWVSGIYV